jgi:hypothetical protein
MINIDSLYGDMYPGWGNAYQFAFVCASKSPSRCYLVSLPEMILNRKLDIWESIAKSSDKYFPVIAGVLN